MNNSANSVATLIVTRQLSPKYAVVISAVTNFIGGICGSAVAFTMGTVILNTEFISTFPPANGISHILLHGIEAAIIWSLISIKIGIPTSVTIGVFGGICGAAISLTGSGESLVWYWQYGTNIWESAGILWKVIIPLFFTPIISFFLADLLMRIFNIALRNSSPAKVNKRFGSLQIVSSALVGLGFGMNTTPKYTAIFVLAAYAAYSQGVMDTLPDYLSFIKITSPKEIPLWLLALGSVILALGTTAGGKKISQNVGWKITHLKPVGGFVAQTTGALILAVLSLLGTTGAASNIMASTVAGTGHGSIPSTIKTRMLLKIFFYWLLSFPVCFILGYLLIVFTRSNNWLY